MDVWHAIQVLKRLGKGKKTIARELRISKTTVKRYWDQNTPPAYTRDPQEKMLDPYAPQIKEMIDQKFIGTRIFHELGQMGYTVSITSLYRYLKHCGGIMHIPLDSGHQFRFIPATDSDARRPPIPEESGRLLEQILGEALWLNHAHNDLDNRPEPGRGRGVYSCRDRGGGSAPKPPDFFA